MTDPDRSTAGGLMRRYRKGLGLTRNGLACRTTTMASDFIKKIEDGQRIGRRSVAIALARALELDPWQTDEFLYVAGHAPAVDWQQVAYDIHLLPDPYQTFKERTESYYRDQEEESHATPAPEAAAPGA